MLLVLAFILHPPDFHPQVIRHVTVHRRQTSCVIAVYASMRWKAGSAASHSAPVMLSMPGGLLKGVSICNKDVTDSRNLTGVLMESRAARGLSSGGLDQPPLLLFSIGGGFISLRVYRKFSTD